MYNLLIRCDQNQTWWETNNILEEDRLFEYTDKKIREMYENNLDKLKGFPCLFTYESQGYKKIKGYIGYIRSIKKKNSFRKELRVIIDYSLAPESSSQCNSPESILEKRFCQDSIIQGNILIIYGFSGRIIPAVLPVRM